MGKKRITVTVDEERYRWLKAQESLNTSGLLNEMLKQYELGGEIPDVALTKRKERVEAQLEQARTELEHQKETIEKLEEELQIVDALLDETRRDIANETEQVVSMVDEGKLPRENVAPDNPAITNYATKAGVTPERLVEAVEAKLNGEG